MSERDASPEELKRLQARFAELIEHHEPMLRRHLAKITFAPLRASYEIDDLIQETLLAAWTIYRKRAPSDDSEEKNADEKTFGGFLRACALHHVMNLARTEARLKRRPLRQPPDPSSGRNEEAEEEDHGAALDFADWKRRMNAALEKLRDGDRKLLRRIYFDLGDSSFKDIGQELGLSKTGAQKRVARAVQRLLEEIVRLQTDLSVLALFSTLEPLYS